MGTEIHIIVPIPFIGARRVRLEETRRLEATVQLAEAAAELRRVGVREGENPGS